MSSVTPFQPTLPAEGVFTDAELAYIEESPPGLFPENQDSNFGFILRKLFTDKIQDLIGQQQTLYNERFVETAVDYLDAWEADYGLPTAPEGRSVAQRRQAVLARLRVGPYTRARRAKIVEDFLTPLLGGTPVALTPAGVPILSGIPLYSGLTSLVGAYAIRENYTTKNLITNGSIETNTNGWSAFHDGTTIARSTTHAKYGSASLKVITPGNIGNEGAYYTAVIGSSVWYSCSCWVYAESQVRLKLQANTYHDSTFLTAFASDDVIVPANVWTPLRVNFPSDPASGTNGVQCFVITNPDAQASTFYIDGAQLWLMDFWPKGVNGDDITGYSDPNDPDFYYEVRLLDSISPDAAMIRELTRITPAGISFDVITVPSP